MVNSFPASCVSKDDAQLEEICRRVSKDDENRIYVKYQSVLSAPLCTNLNSLLRSSAAFQWKVQPFTSITSNFTQVSVYCVEF